MSIRTIALVIAVLDAAVVIAVAFATFLSGSDPATKGLDIGAGLAVVALFVVTGAPALALLRLRRAPRTSLILAIAFPATFAVLFGLVVMAWSL
jgi:hypothetical protein